MQNIQLNSKNNISKEVFQQLQSIADAPPKTRWKVVGEARFERISFFKYLLETMKGWFCCGKGNRASSTALEFELMRLVRNFAMGENLKNEHVDLILSVVKKMGIVPTKAHKKEHSPLHRIIHKMSEQIFSHQSYKSESYQTVINQFYNRHQKILKHIISNPFLERIAAVAAKEQNPAPIVPPKENLKQNYNKPSENPLKKQETTNEPIKKPIHAQILPSKIIDKQPLPELPPVINQEKDPLIDLTKPQKKIKDQKQEKNADPNKDETPAKKEESPFGNQNSHKQEPIDQKKPELNPILNKPIKPIKAQILPFKIIEVEPLPEFPSVINQDNLDLQKPQNKVQNQKEEKNADQNKDEIPAKKEELPLENQNPDNHKTIDPKIPELNPVINEEPILLKNEENLHQSEEKKPQEAAQVNPIDDKIPPVNAPVVPEQKVIDKPNEGKFEIIEDYEPVNPNNVQKANIHPFANIPLKIEENLYKENLDFISSIPDQAGIKINSVLGKLGRADGWWSEFFKWQAVLSDDALNTIHQTLSISLREFDMAYNTANNCLPENENAEIRKVSDRLIHLMNLTDGLNRYYSNCPEKDLNNGLKKLKVWIDQFAVEEEKAVQKHKELALRLKLKNLDLNESIIEPQKKSQASIETASQSLNAYCALYCDGMESSRAQALINTGQALMKAIYQNKLQTPKNAPECEEHLIAITWFLTYIAIKKKQGFDEGAFVIEDTDNLLLNYLTNCPGAAKRDSSHFIGRSPNSWLSAKHLGLDVFNKEMPGKKRTIDFVEIDAYEENKKQLFFKPENYSPFITNYYDFAMHGVELVHALERKRQGNGGDDKPGMRKERVPDHTKKAFIDLIQYLPPNQINFETNRGFVKLVDLKSNASKWGIAFMYDFVERYKKTNPQGQLKEAIQAFDETIDGMDNLSKRTGREVFITAKDMEDFIKEKLPEAKPLLEIRMDDFLML